MGHGGVLNQESDVEEVGRIAHSLYMSLTPWSHQRHLRHYTKPVQQTGMQH